MVFSRRALVRRGAEFVRHFWVFRGQSPDLFEEYFAAHGFRKEARLLQEGVRRGDYLSVKHLVTDEMAQTFVVCGTPDEVRARVSAIWDTADSACLNPPSYGLEMGAMLQYGAKIAQLFYA